MGDFYDLENQDDMDFLLRQEIKTELGQQNEEEAQGDAPVLAQTVSNHAAAVSGATFGQIRGTKLDNANQTVPGEAITLTGKPKGESANDFSSWERLLLNSEKGGLGWMNSKYFRRVQNALEATVRVLSKGFGNSTEGNMAILLEACNAFQTLLNACKQYTARNPRTKKGQARRELVLQIQEYAQRDLYGCGDAYHEFREMPPQDQARENWQAVLSRSRTLKMTVDDFSKLQSPGGGQASEVFKIESQEGTKYFKREDGVNVDVVKQKGDQAPRYLAWQETREKYPDLPQEDWKLFSQLDETTSDKMISAINFSKEGAVAAKFFVSRIKQLDTNINSLMKPMGIVDEGGTANMSRRNVATSRIAELLGLGKLVAKSRTVEIYDNATGKTIRGNLMDQAEGKDYYDQINTKLQQREITSGFMRDVTNLQVLDMLCGQVDRHERNMLYKTDNQGRVSGIQAIDNDAAFGMNEDAVSSSKANSDRKDARVFDLSGEMIIPYMDAELAERIENLDEAVVRYVLSDLLKKEEIDKTIFRLNVMKKGIQQAKVEHEERFLKKEEDWTLMERNQAQTKSDQNKKSVEEVLMESYEKILEQTGSDASNNKDLILKTAREMFKKEEPEKLKLIEEFKKDPVKFNNEHDTDTKNKVRSVLNDVSYRNLEKLMQKYWGNRNYFGRIMS